jgi:hydrophobe/amphiphile efflux-1 (HAE1) family protein
VNVCEPFIRRPVATTLLAIGLFLLGIVSYHLLPVAPIPRVDFAMVSVNASLPGADPETVASSLAAPLERHLSQISGVSEITSTSTLGGTSISVQFDLSRKIEGAARDVQAAINAASSDLPINLPQPPTYRKSNPADAPIMVLAMTSDSRPVTEVFEAADEIVGQQLSQLDGVSQVMISGGAKSAVRVQVNPAALASIGSSLEDVRAFLTQANVNRPKGSVDGEQASYTIYSNDQLLGADEYKDLVFAQKNGTPILLSSFAKIVEGVENTRLGGWNGMKPAVLLVVFKQADANVIETVDRIRAALPQTELWLPPSVKLEVLSDRTVTIRASVEEVQYSLLLSIALVVMVIFLFLRRFWPTFIASVTVPLALAGTFGAMYLLGYSLDNLSLMAVTISVGFVVDDAIVVIENVFRFMEKGDSAMVAGLKGARQIGFTVISMSISLVAVFIPLLFMGGLVGRLFHEFAVTLSVAVLVSGVISLTLTPMMCSRLLKPAALERAPGAFYRASEAVFNWMLGGYEKALRGVLRHPGFTIIAAALTVVATVWLYAIVPKGFFPQQDTGMISGSTEASQDISFPAMQKLNRRIVQIVLEDPAVATVGSFIGGGFGSSSVNTSRLFIALKPRAERGARGEEIIERIRRKASAVEGIRLIMQAMQDVRTGTRGSRAQFQYALQSGDLEELKRWVPRVVEKLSELPEIKDVSSDLQMRGLQSTVTVDRDAAARLGVSPAAIDNTLYDAFGQRQVSTIYRRYNQHHVVLEADPQFQLEPSSLQKIYVRSNTGVQVPLASVAKFQTDNASLSVNHQGQFPAVTLSFNLAPGVSLGRATDLVEEATHELKMPASVHGSFQGTAQIFQASLKSLPLLLAAALFAVYIVLGILYESLIHPLTIISTLPSAGVGALLALMITGKDLSLISFIGIILLMGIVKKNAIMMIDFALDAQRNDGMSAKDAIFKACIIRFRPIMMTTLAALFGALPIAIGHGAGSELRQPLGIAVIGGLIVSQVLTLLTTPVIYLALERLRTFSRKKRGSQQIATAGGAPAAHS